MRPQRRAPIGATPAVHADAGVTVDVVRGDMLARVESHAPTRVGFDELERLVALVRTRQAQLNEDTTALRYLFRLRAGPSDP